MLGGCDVQTKNPANADGNVAVRADESGHITLNLPIVEGQLNVPASVMHNSNFDIDGVKLMPGSSVTGVSVFARDQGASTTIAFAAPASPGDVRSYFADRFQKKGVEVALAGNTLSGKTKDGTPFTIQVASAGSGSKGTIIIQSKD
jgi:hypothetical protein